MAYQSETEQKEELAQLESSLKDIPRFIKDHPFLTYIEFDYYTVHDLTLFSVAPDFDINAFKETLDKLNAALPSIKRVFSKPFIVLKDTAEVLPVEVVTKINQDTLVNLGNHAYNVANITSKGVKPRKLLTQVYVDDYGIYENLVFCDFVDAVIRYSKKNLRSLKHLLYASQTLDLNFLERVNHMDYYLALGKLHTGYVRDYEKYYVIAKDLYKKTVNIINVLKSRMIKPVYKNNRRRTRTLSLKKTNIFLMQKSYHQVYLTYKYLLNHNLTNQEIKEDIDLNVLRKEYFSYVQILSIFALGHFNFKCDSSVKMDLNNLDSTFLFKGWSIRLSSVKNEVILMTICKESTYKIILAPSICFTYQEELEDYKKRYQADEVVLCTPYEDDYITSKTLYISVDNIDSFRRLQQLYLRGMIYADTTRTICPFCGEQLHFNKKSASYECDNCRMVIQSSICPTTNTKYFYTSIYKLPLKEIGLVSYNSEDRWIYSQKVESAMYFRNITKIDNSGKIICPICLKVHTNQ